MEGGRGGGGREERGGEEEGSEGRGKGSETTAPRAKGNSGEEKEGGKTARKS